MTIARQNGFYAIERFLSLAMLRKSPDWAVSRYAFATKIDDGEPSDCRQAAFEDEPQLHFFTEFSNMNTRRVTHEWLFDGQPVQRTEFEVDGDRWSTHSSRAFSPADVGTWDVRIVTDTGEVLRTERLRYNALTDYNKRNRDKMLGYCNVGAPALSALAKAQAPIADLEYLLDKGTVMNLQTNLRGLASRAIAGDSIRLVGWMIEHDFDIETYVDGAETPLLLATKNGKAAMALYLITRGAEVRHKDNRNKQSALHLNVFSSNTEIAEILLQQGANPNTVGNSGYTPLHSAVHKCDIPMTLVLLEHGADPALENDKGETPRDIVAICNTREAWDPKLTGLASLYPS